MLVFCRLLLIVCTSTDAFCTQNTPAMGSKWKVHQRLEQTNRLVTISLYFSQTLNRFKAAKTRDVLATFIQTFSPHTLILSHGITFCLRNKVPQCRLSCSRPSLQAANQARGPLSPRAWLYTPALGHLLGMYVNKALPRLSSYALIENSNFPVYNP